MTIQAPAPPSLSDCYALQYSTGAVYLPAQRIWRLRDGRTVRSVVPGECWDIPDYLDTRGFVKNPVVK